MTRPLLLPLLLVGTTGFICHDDHNGSSTPPHVPMIDSVAVVPANVYASPGASFQLEVRVLDTQNRVVETDAYAEISVHWSATTAGLFADPTANPVLVQVPSSPGVTLGGIRATVRREVNGQFKEVTSDPGQIFVAQPPVSSITSNTLTPSTGDDMLAVEHSPGSMPVAVLLDARAGSGCVQDWALAVAGMADLGRDLTSDPSCQPGPTTASDGAGSEITIFASGRSMVHERPMNGPWAAGPEYEERDPLPPNIVRGLVVRVGVPVDTGNIEVWGQVAAQEAATILDRNRAGILVEWIGMFEHGRHAPVSDVQAACDAPALNAMLPSNANLATQGTVYVLFVNEVGDAGAGWACKAKPGWIGQVIYLSMTEEFSPTTFAHELGHALSLAPPHVGFGGGHANAISGLTRANLMWNSTALDVRQTRERLSVGQIYRMNFHPSSVLNRVIPSPKTRPCQSATKAGVCPDLIEELGEATP